jgi:hypothetical protein
MQKARQAAKRFRDIYCFNSGIRMDPQTFSVKPLMGEP